MPQKRPDRVNNATHLGESSFVIMGDEPLVVRQFLDPRADAGETLFLIADETGQNDTPRPLTCKVEQ